MAGRTSCHENITQEVNPEDLENREGPMPSRDVPNVVSEPPPPPSLQEHPKTDDPLNKTTQDQETNETKKEEEEEKIEDDFFPHPDDEEDEDEDDEEEEDDDFIPYYDDDYSYPDEDEEDEDDEEEEEEDKEEEGGGGGGGGSTSSNEKGKNIYSTVSYTFNRPAFKMIKKRPHEDIGESSNPNPPERVKKTMEESSRSGEKDAFLEGLMIDVNRELAFLNSLVEYHTRNLVYPFENSIALEDYIKEWLKIDVPKEELTEKIILLKRKYSVEAEKIADYGPQAQEAIELCKKIWGTTTSSDIRAAIGDDSSIINETSLLEKHRFVGSVDVKMEEKGTGTTSGEKDHVMEFLERLSGDDVNADIAFLNELVAYHSNNLIYPFENIIALYDFIQDWLKIDVSKEKMREIFNGLKMKYREMAKKPNLGPQQLEAIKLVKNIWPNEIETQSKEDEDVKESPKDGSEHDSS